jgi:hypothetical protein
VIRIRLPSSATGGECTRVLFGFVGLLLILLLYLVGGVPLATSAVVASGSAAGGASAAQVSASLAITVWPNGSNGRVVRWTLRCAPARGSLPRPGQACRRLSALQDPFAPVPKQTACTEIYGGPQVARVRGSFRAASVEASFNRRNGCEIGRWNRVAFLFPTHQ